jgi:hypothetical protein
MTHNPEQSFSSQGYQYGSLPNTDRLFLCEMDKVNLNEKDKEKWSAPLLTSLAAGGGFFSHTI